MRFTSTFEKDPSSMTFDEEPKSTCDINTMSCAEQHALILLLACLLMLDLPWTSQTAYRCACPSFSLRLGIQGQGLGPSQFVEVCLVTWIQRRELFGA
ncbi:unnamed protein product [Prunus armeniaca]